VQVTNLVRTMERLKALGIWIVGLDLETDRSLYEVDFRLPSALVVGNEQKGLRPLVRKGCDLLARIPALGPLQSLNAGNAAAVALSEIQRQRDPRQIRPSSPAPRK
jgi:23S rRNA (guanosine2251-2'-O)-methyltransferase